MSSKGRKASDEPTPAPKRRRSLAGKAEDENDPEWKRWFQEVDRRRKALIDPKKRGLVVSTVEKDGQPTTVARPRSDPVLVKKILGKTAKSADNPLNMDMMLIKTAWRNTVGDDMARETEVFSFKNGILTISVFSSPLLQEIRQFHKEAIDTDLRESWPLSMPLVRVTYKTGKR